MPRPGALPTWGVGGTVSPVGTEGAAHGPIYRFFVKPTLGYPSGDGESEILRRWVDRLDSTPQSGQDLDGPEEILALQQVPETVQVGDDMLRYISESCPVIREDPRVRVGVSPRGTQRLLECTRARAVIEGRGYASRTT